MLLAILQLPPPVIIPQQLHNLNSLNTQRVRNSGLVEECTHASIIYYTGGKGQSWSWAGELRTGPDLYTTYYYTAYTILHKDFLPLLCAALILDTHTVRAVYKCWEKGKGRTMKYTALAGSEYWRWDYREA